MASHTAFAVFAYSLVSSAFALFNGSEPSEYILDFPTNDNPLGIRVVSPANMNYFMLIGDWGAPSGESTYEGVQQVVANKMKAYYESQKSKGYNLLFVAAVGDNFYWTGQDCNEWTRAFTNMYGPNLTSVPWLAIMGNHDWGNSDPDALCAWNKPRYTSPAGIPYAANQLNKDKGGCNPSLYYMPDFAYYYTINELNFELIGLDENGNDCPNGLGGNGASGGASQLFANCGGSTSVGCGYLNKIKTASENMLWGRARASSNKNFVIIQHYPGVGQNLVNEFVKYRNQSDLPEEMIVAAYGHTHSQQCDRSFNSKYGALCNSIMTGGGGGCCGEYTRRGFFVLGFNSDKHMVQLLDITDSQISCEYPCGVVMDEAEKEKILKDTCCHTMDDPQCDKFDFSVCHQEL